METCFGFVLCDACYSLVPQERVRAAGNNLARADMEDYLDDLEEATFARAQLHYGAQVGLD